MHKVTASPKCICDVFRTKDLVIFIPHGMRRSGTEAFGHAGTRLVCGVGTCRNGAVQRDDTERDGAVQVLRLDGGTARSRDEAVPARAWWRRLGAAMAGGGALRRGHEEVSRPEGQRKGGSDRGPDVAVRSGRRTRRGGGVSRTPATVGSCEGREREGEVGGREERGGDGEGARATDLVAGCGVHGAAGSGRAWSRWACGGWSAGRRRQATWQPSIGHGRRRRWHATKW